MNFEYVSGRPDPITGAKPLTQTSSAALLHQILTQCRCQRLVFDLDSTLLDNRARSARIMQEFGALRNEPLLLQASPDHWQDWSARNAMTAMGLTARAVDEHVDAYIAFWEDRFFTSDFCQYDTALAGAANYVADLYGAGAIICYLTGRHEGMRSGTEDSLKKLGFPVPGLRNVSLIMKPEQSISDDDYKKTVMARFNNNGGILAAFDNEPYHINAYRSAFPQATCVHLHTDHSMRSIRLLEGIVSIESFSLQ